MIVYKIWAKLNWHFKMALMLILFGGIALARHIWPLPVLNLFFVWTLILCVGTAVRYISRLIALSPRHLIASVAGRVSRFSPSRLIASVWAIAQTFTFITFTRLFFRSGSNLDPATASQEAWETAKNMVNQIGGAWNSSIIPAFLWEYRYVVLLFILGMIIHWLPTRVKRWYRVRFALLPMWVMILVVVLAVVCVYQFVTADMQAFIYFQF
jgi:hypothetical protein